jgi:hypothetical protein
LKAGRDGRGNDKRALYEKAAEAYPQDKEVLCLAGEQYIFFTASSDTIARALPWFERARALDPFWAGANGPLITTVLPVVGRQEEALAIARQWVAKAPGPRSQGALVTALLRSGQMTEAVEAARRLLEIAPNWDSRYVLTRALILSGRAGEVEALLQPLVREGAPVRDLRDGLPTLAIALGSQGRRREAIELLGRTERIPGFEDMHLRNWWIPFQRWLLQVDERNPGPALREAAVLKKRGDSASRALYLGLPFLGDDAGAAEAASMHADGAWDKDLHQGIAMWRSGDPDGAVVHIQGLADREAARQSLATWWVAYVALDARKDALGIRAADVYERSVDPWLVFRAWGLGRLLYKKAEAQERQGDRAGAVSTLERSLAMWARADPDLPMLAETRALCRKLGCKDPRANAARR